MMYSRLDLCLFAVYECLLFVHLFCHGKKGALLLDVVELASSMTFPG